MKATACLFLLASLCTASWLAWQEYGFLFSDIEAVDVTDISLEEEKPSTDAPINLDFLNESHTEQPLDLSFLSDQDPIQAEPIDLDFLQDEFSSTNNAESLIADFMGVKSIDSIDVDGIVTNPICIFDPVGPGGDINELVKSFKSLALGRGVNLDIKTFNNESVIVDSFKAGRCDVIAVTGMQARPFNNFTASIEAVGGLPHYADLQRVLRHLSQDEAAPHMRQGDYEVAAIIPIGNVYAFMRDARSVRGQSLSQQFQGQRVGVFESNQASLEMIRQLGATPVMVNSTSFAGKFNNGAVDIIFAPAVAYQPLELHRGLGDKGRILRYPLIQLTYQLILREDKFPAGFAALLRQAAYNGRGFAMEYVHLTEKQIPAVQWLTPPAEAQAELEEALLDAQQKLFKKGVYDKAMLDIMRRARCQRRADHAECSSPQL